MVPQQTRWTGVGDDDLERVDVLKVLSLSCEYKRDDCQPAPPGVNRAKRTRCACFAASSLRPAAARRPA
jgi:hypothetical protein